MNKLYFDINSRIIVDGENYLVLGKISFINYADNYKWTEYKLRTISGNEVRWLSVDETYDEYAIYFQKRYSREFNEGEIFAKGYKESDYGKAKVIEVVGVSDTDVGDIVNYREFEDETEEKIIAIEDWEGEKEYSTGYYLDRDEIKKVDGGNYSSSAYSSSSYENKDNFINLMTSNKTATTIIAAIIMVTIAVVGYFAFKNINGSQSILEYVKSSGDYEYSTSITSEVETKERADVYKSKLSVENTSKNIIEAIEGNVEDVQENTEDGTVAILTKEEYCLVYLSESNETLVQVSTRLYAYTSSNTPYNSRGSTAHYYRRYYYSRGYSSDSTRYDGHTTSYGDYNEGTVNSSTNDKYKSYSDSVRQSSTSSRTSSGGGTSSGK